MRSIDGSLIMAIDEPVTALSPARTSRPTHRDISTVQLLIRPQHRRDPCSFGIVDSD